MKPVTFVHEAPRRLRAAFLGTSGHAFRNYLPSLPYTAVDLVALWDPDAARAKAFAQVFGALSWYTDLDRLLREAAPDAVLIAVDGFDNGQPAGMPLMARCLQAGCHVWADKPVAATTSAVRDLIALRDRSGRIAAVGAKTMHNPAYQKIREIVSRPEFGPPASFTCRYPLRVPRLPGLPLADPEVSSCLNHIWHPMGVALLTMGTIAAIGHHAAPRAGGVAVATFRSGAVGAFHFSHGQPQTSPLERVEVVGDGANVVVDNAAHLTWYRRGRIGDYGRAPSYFTSEDEAPLTWQPEMSLGQLYNNNNFLQGYAPSLIEFVDAALTSQPLRHGTLEDALHILAVFEALCADATGRPQPIDTGERTTQTLTR
jgi:predicted dehydrogenase